MIQIKSTIHAECMRHSLSVMILKREIGFFMARTQNIKFTRPVRENEKLQSAKL